MAYTTAASIQAFYVNITFSTSTRPTLAQVEQWIVEADGIIDGALSSVYATPITGTTALQQVKALSELYVLDNINFVLGHNKFSVNQNKELIPKKLKHAEFYNLLKMYQGDPCKCIEPTMILADAPRNTTKLKSASYNKTNSIEQVAQKGVDQW